MIGSFFGLLCFRSAMAGTGGQVDKLSTYLGRPRRLQWKFIPPPLVPDRRNTHQRGVRANLRLLRQLFGIRGQSHHLIRSTQVTKHGSDESEDWISLKKSGFTGLHAVALTLGFKFFFWGSAPDPAGALPQVPPGALLSTYLPWPQPWLQGNPLSPTVEKNVKYPLS